jgi:hypothetical protein
MELKVTNKHGFHYVTNENHDVTLVRNGTNYEVTYTEIRKIPLFPEDMVTAKLFKAVICLNSYPWQATAKLFVWRDGWKEFHSQLTADLPCAGMVAYKDCDEIDLSKLDASCEHLWLMAKEYAFNV